MLDWTARQTVAGKRGATPEAIPPILKRLSLDSELWCNLVGTFGRLFFNVAGLPPTIETTTSRVTQRRYYVPSAARKLFSSTVPSSPA